MRFKLTPVTPVCFTKWKIGNCCTGNKDNLCAYCKLNKHNKGR